MIKKRTVNAICTGVLTAAVVLGTMRTPFDVHALERAPVLPLTNYAPLYLDPPGEERPQGGTGRAGGGTTVIDPGTQSNSGTQTTNDRGGEAAQGSDTTDNAGAGTSGQVPSGAYAPVNTADGGSSATTGTGATPATPTPNPYTASANTKDMPATGVEDMRRSVVSVILILFGIVTILISIPTMKGKRRGA